MNQEERYTYLSMQVDTLERELQLKTSHAEEALRSEIALRAKVDQMENDFKQEQGTTFAVTSDMARQYKSLQEELIYKINALETQLTEQKEELDITNHELRELIRDKDEDIEHKDQQIAHLTERMNEMSQEFANMLRETLELMKKHITDKFPEGAEEGDVNEADLTQQFQDYSARAYNSVSASASATARSVRSAIADAGAELSPSPA
eukprot:CAMPEP_0194529708 /NCGR_PEP_ID=MMETSP0253-20130528/66483_1 /TAXON_ID=2966 /ORGANISM="Noctiluca scintillans" /LENGTH=206 /DNA_ID=CAMNT_0039374865 /DNA_START=78 /DNA_END=698 /DNA_ORIENTATION=+